MNILSDTDKRSHICQLINQALKQAKKHSDENPEEKEKEVFRLFATIETKRVDVERRKRNQDLREKQAEENENKKVRMEEEFNKNWREGGRLEKRIGNWRDFQKR